MPLCLITRCHATHCELESETRHIPPPPPPASPRCVAISVQISLPEPTALAASPATHTDADPRAAQSGSAQTCYSGPDHGPPLTLISAGLYLTLCTTHTRITGRARLHLRFSDHWLSLLQAASLSPPTPIVRLLIDSDTQRSTSESNIRSKDEIIINLLVQSNNKRPNATKTL